MHMISGCHLGWRWKRRSLPLVRDTLQGLLEGFGRISPSHHMLIIADAQVHFTGILRMEPMVSVPTEFSWEGLSCPSWGALVATKDTASADANLNSKRIIISGLGGATRNFRPKHGFLSPQPLPRPSPHELPFQHKSHQATSFLLCLL